MKLRLLAASALLLLSVSPALAHRFWIIPSTSVLSGDDQWVTFDAAISNNLFFPNHHSAPLTGFTVTGPDGKAVEIQNGKEGRVRTTFDVQLTQPGTYKAATVRETLSAVWTENGEQKRWRGNAETFASEGIKDKPGVKVSRNVSRVETVVTSGEPSLGALKPTGKGLELVVDKNHPTDLVKGEKASFLLHFNGKPAANLKVTVVKGDDRYRNEAGETAVTTDAEGRFEVTFPETGRYWLNAVTEGEGAKVEGVPTTSRSSYTMTFEVLPE
ncbi:MAG: DUF4198 domain-containing protein [Verrucomicrobiaceae bacterium]|nr:MAG: DUF4198 domain-containing protein [Verrucomicrobiaceae bacterium]